MLGGRNICPLESLLLPSFRFGDLRKLVLGQGSRILIDGWGEVLLQTVARVADIIDESGVQEHKKAVCEHS